jgi:hypothetical protein
VKIFVLTTLQLLFVGYLSAQRDTVRWYQQNDKSIYRTSNNPIIELRPVYGRGELVIVENYDSKRKLLQRATTIDEKCYAGKYFEVDVDTKVEVIGYYLNCGLKDGNWTYVTTNGDTIAKEQWSNGQFVKEIIKQEHNSIWTYKVMLNKKEYTNQGIDVTQRFRLTITLFFKNDLEMGRKHFIKCTIFRGPKLIDEKDFAGDTDFNRFDHYSWYKKNKLRSGDRINLAVYQFKKKEELVGFNNILVE